jgi:hypothetical protein
MTCPGIGGADEHTTMQERGRMNLQGSDGGGATHGVAAEGAAVRARRNALEEWRCGVTAGDAVRLLACGGRRPA